VGIFFYVSLRFDDRLVKLSVVPLQRSQYDSSVDGALLVSLDSVVVGERKR
jgi:hypothetical protein